MWHHPRDLMKRLWTAAFVVLGTWVLPAVAMAQTKEQLRPKHNWVFLLGLVTLAGFVLFIGFVGAYYLLAVVARNRNSQRKP